METRKGRLSLPLKTTEEASQNTAPPKTNKQTKNPQPRNP